MSIAFDVPDKLPKSKVDAFLADLGIPITGLIELTVGVRGVRVQIRAVNEDGKPYLNRDRTLAVHDIAIPMDWEA